MKTDCEKFLSTGDVRALLEQANETTDFPEAMVAHDFWLTRNGHGAGFWDRGLGKVGDELTKTANSFGECDLFHYDDCEIHLV